MKLNRILLLFLFLSPICLQAQDYLFPVKPGQRSLLSGNFSEIRPNHFHSGIDVKIGGVEGEPILAIADGYVSRIKVSSYGYGNVLYIKHPNGQSSVYAHLRNFSPKIMDFMRKEMYFAQKNELELFPDPEFLPVKRGEIIGNGGNTGGSGGPHLHFEIRDSLERALDPLAFNFKEVVDKTPPVLYKVAFRPLDMDARVNGKYQREEFTPLLEGGKYILNQPIKITGRVGIEIYAVDKKDGVNNIFGVPIYELIDNGKPLYRINVDKVDFNLGRFLLTHTHQNRFIRLYQYPNNPLEIYQPDSVSAGAITADVGQKKILQINMKDVFGNARVLSVNVEGQDYQFDQNENHATKPASAISYYRDIMIINTGLSNQNTLAKVFAKGLSFEISPTYIHRGQTTYLWDMNYGIPDSLDLCTEVIKSPVLAKIPFKQEFAYDNDFVGIKFGEQTLLDDLYLRTNRGLSSGKPSLTINSHAEYLQSNMDVTFKNTVYRGNKNQAHIYFQAENGRKSFVGGIWQGDDIHFKTRNFGTFVIDEDPVPPKITPIKVTSGELRFKITDDKSGIRDFELSVNGEWVLMRYEHKQAVIWSEKLEQKPFKGEVILKVRDMAGNETRWATTLN